MESIAYYKERDFDGIDASLEISLFEYGLIWGIRTEEPNDYFFVYGVGSDGENYNLFDHAHIAINTDPEEEWNFADFNQVASFCGMSKEEFLKGSLPMIIFDLVSYYGRENIFGGSYYPYEIEP